MKLKKVESRDIYELLSLLYINLKFEEKKFFGLCNYCCLLAESDLITNEEYDKLIEYIENNAPIRYKITYFIDSFFDTYVFCLNGAYYWKQNRKRPRLRWLKKHMKRTKNK